MKIISLCVAALCLFQQGCHSNPNALALKSRVKDQTTAIRALYFPSRRLNSLTLSESFETLKSTGFNAMVVDIKDVWGTVSISTPKIKEATFGPDYEQLDVATLMKRAKAEKIYLIARIAMFQDACLVKKHPDWAASTKDGKPYVTYADSPCGPGGFISPYKHAVWKYHLKLAKAAVKLGFDEIQLDYVRFPDELELRIPGEPKPVRMGDPYSHRIGVIMKGVKYIRQRLPREVALSVDVFGVTVKGPYSVIGQDIAALAPFVDYICPMIYPSLWDASGLNMSVAPEQDPYTAIRRSLEAYKKLNLPPTLQVRPWLQIGDFGTVVYGRNEAIKQMNAAIDEGIESWAFWDSSGKYPKGSLGFP